MNFLFWLAALLVCGIVFLISLVHLAGWWMLGSLIAAIVSAVMLILSAARGTSKIGF